MVNPELQIFKCFGCGKAGDVFSFVQEMEGLEFGETLRMLAEKVGVTLTFRGDEKKSEKEELVAIQELAAEYYHYLLTQHQVGEEAREYLKSRKISEKIIKEFRLGFALSAWDGIYEFLVVKKKKNVALVERTGLILESNKKKGQYYDRFRNRVMFPLWDHRGQVVAFAGRVMPGNRDEEPKYINSPETLVYHKSEMLYGLSAAKKAIREKDRVVIVEGELDMISSFAAGVSETVAIKGSALTEEQINRLGRLTKNLVLALDADTAGEAAMKRGIHLAEEKGMNIKVIQVIGGKDPDDVARENPNKWMKLVEKAVDVYQFYLDSSLTKYDVGTTEGKRKVSEEVVPVLAKITNKVVQAVYMRKLADTLGVSEEGVMKETERVAKGLPGTVKQEVDKPVKPRSREELLIEEILSLLFTVKIEKAVMEAKKLVEMGLNVVEMKVLREWLSFVESGGGDMTVFINQLPSELKVLAQTAYMKEWEIEKGENDLRVAVGELKRLRLTERLKAVAIEISRAENRDEDERVKELQEEFVLLSRRLKS